MGLYANAFMHLLLPSMAVMLLLPGMVVTVLLPGIVVRDQSEPCMVLIGLRYKVSLPVLAYIISLSLGCPSV